MNVEVIKNKNHVNNPQMTDLQMLSHRQVELAFKMRQYRMIHDISQVQMSMIATIYGKKYNTVLTNYDISIYENFKRLPSEKKMNAILDMLGITVEDLDA